MDTLGLTYDDVPLRVESDDRAALAWLEEFLSPSFESGVPRESALAVSYTVDPARFAVLAAASRANPGRTRACWALDTRVVALPAGEHEGNLVLLDEAHGCAILLTPGRVEVVADSRAQGRRLPLLRVVRELAATAYGSAAGRVSLHAAAFATGDEVFVLAGPKEAGKTTLLVEALTEGDARFVANDRVFATLSRGGVVVRGMPTVVSVRPFTLDAFPALRRGVPATSTLSHLTVAEARAAGAGSLGPPTGERLRLSPALFRSLLGVEAVPAGRLAAVLLCEVEPSLPARRVHRLGPAEAAAGLAACEYGRGTDRAAGTAFHAWIGVQAPLPTSPWAELAARVPVFRCRSGAGAVGRSLRASDLVAVSREPVA